MFQINEQSQTLVKSLLRVSNSASKRALRNSITKEIRSGIFKGKYNNANEVMVALNAGKLSRSELKFIYKTLFLNSTDPKMIEEYSKIFFKNKTVIGNLKGLNKNAFKTELKSKGFSDDQIKIMEKVWKDEGFTFGNATTNSGSRNRLSTKPSGNINSYSKFKDEFDNFRKYKLDDDFVDVVANNLKNFRFLKPFKGMNLTSTKRLVTWLLTGQRILPREIYAIFKRNGLLGVLGGVSGSFVRGYIRLWFLSLIVTIAKKAWIEHQNDFQEREFTPEEQSMFIWNIIVDSIPGLKYYVPWDIMRFLWSNLYYLAKAVGTGGSTWSELKELWGIPSSAEIIDVMVPEDKQDIFNVIDEEKYVHIKYNRTNNELYWDKPEYPIRKINGRWCVLIPNDGWYLIEDIE